MSRDVYCKITEQGTVQLAHPLYCKWGREVYIYKVTDVPDTVTNRDVVKQMTRVTILPSIFSDDSTDWVVPWALIFDKGDGTIVRTRLTK